MAIRCSIGGPKRKLKRSYPCLMRLTNAQDPHIGTDDVIVLMIGEGADTDPLTAIGKGMVVASNVAEYPVGYMPGMWALSAFEDYAGYVTLENKP